jgi:hypothetical protein
MKAAPARGRAGGRLPMPSGRRTGRLNSVDSAAPRRKQPQEIQEFLAINRTVDEQVRPEVPRRSHHLPPPQIRSKFINPRGQARELAGRNGGEEVVLQVVEHAVADDVLEPAALGAGDGVLVAAAVDDPDSEEAGKALADDHRRGVPTEAVGRREQKDGGGCRENQQDFSGHPAALGG